MDAIKTKPVEDSDLTEEQRNLANVAGEVAREIARQVLFRGENLTFPFMVEVSCPDICASAIVVDFPPPTEEFNSMDALLAMKRASGPIN